MKGSVYLSSNVATKHNMQNVLITGGNGYLGSVLVQHLIRHGVEVHALVHRSRNRLDELLATQNIHAVGSNIDAIEVLTAELRPDVIFHLAGKHAEPATMTDTADMIQSNLTVGTALLRGAVQCNRQPIFVNTGSFWQFSEQDSFSPNSFYAATKQAFMDLMHFFERVKNLRSTTLILYDTFGVDDPRPKLWTSILNAPAGTRLSLTEGRQLIDLVHVDDVASAFVYAAELLSRGEVLERTYAVRSERKVTLRELVESLNRLAGSRLELDWGAIPYKAGQIFIPWQGPLLPGWHAEINIEKATSEYFQHRTAGILEKD
jgi:nucleoside-diphosphate-sugar epimerase